MSWQDNPLQKNTCDKRLWIFEYISKRLNLYAQRYTKHYECQNDIDNNHLTSTQIDIQGIQIHQQLLHTDSILQPPVVVGLVIIMLKKNSNQVEMNIYQTIKQ